MPLTRPGPALVKVTGWFGGTPLHEPAYRGIAKRSKAWDFDSHIRRFKSCYPCHSRPLGFSARDHNKVDSYPCTAGPPLAGIGAYRRATG